MGRGERCLRKLPCFYVAGAVVIRVLHTFSEGSSLVCFCLAGRTDKKSFAKVLILPSLSLSSILSRVS